jgi:hypothetical protein
MSVDSGVYRSDKLVEILGLQQLADQEFVQVSWRHGSVQGMYLVVAR